MQHPNDDPATKAEIVAKAIKTRQMIEATYNGALLTLAPHQLFVRRDSLYVGAINPQKARRQDEEPTLGVFKLAGLSKVSVTGLAFDPVTPLGGQPSQPEDMVLASVAQG
ncbi:MAG: hypothetical protein KGL48_17930 [Sphingomonadales bacterium]|nr:hypothetical protein [Sphingomonadales bacterium]MDE2568626.1 hypothetical protein [Sphingomonadales bacterium]